MEGKLSSTRTARLIRALTRNEWSDEARAASAKKRKEKAQQKGSWWGAAGKAALIGGGALAGGLLGARTLPRLIGKGRVLEAGESLAGKILYHHEGLTKPSDIIRIPLTKKARELSGQRFASLEQILRKASKGKGLKGKAARVARKVDEFLGIPQRHYAVGLGAGRVADITRGEGQRIIPVTRLGKDVRVHGEGRLVPKGTKMVDEAKAMNPKELKAFEERYGSMKDWKKGDLCTIGDKNCEAYARGIGEGRKVSTQIRALKAGLIGGAAVGAAPGTALAMRKKKQVNNVLINKWSDAARKKSAESRKRKAMSSAKKGALIGAGVAGGANALAQTAHAGLMRGVEESMRIPGLPNSAAKSLLRIPLKTRAAGLGAAVALGGLAGAGIGKLLDRFKRQRKQVQNTLQVINGGPGSGHHGHKGIPGQRGGSLPEGASAPSGRQYTRELRALIPAAPVSETPQARAKRIKNVYTKASRLADVYETYAGELEKKRWNKLLPLKKAQVEELARVHAKAAENFYSSADQATMLKGRTPTEQIDRLRRADHHAQLAMKYTKRLGYNPTTGRPLPKSAMGEFTRSLGRAFVSGMAGAAKESAYKAGRATTKVGLDIAGEAIRGGIRGGKEAVTKPAEKRMAAISGIRAELERARKYSGAVRTSIKSKASKMKTGLPEGRASLREIIKGIARGTGSAAKERALAHKERFAAPRTTAETDLETTRRTIQAIMDARAQLEARAKSAGVTLTGRARKFKSGSSEAGIPKEVKIIGAKGQEVVASDSDIEKDLKAKVDAVLAARKDNEFTTNFSPITANLSGQVRRETLHGKEFLVAPLSMIVPGVLPGSKGPLLYPEDEVRKNPSAWNNIPIVVNHPMKDGIPVEARSPDILERYQIGTVFNARYNGKLTAEGWFDVERTRKVNTGVYDMLLNGRPIELSTGLYTDNEPFEGVHNGREYKFIARNYRPDHLAILLTSKGACSIKDGCGVLINKESPTANIVHKIKGGYKLVSHKGKNLGTAKTKAGIMKRERQVEYFKHVKNEHICNEIRGLVHNGVYSAAGKQLLADAFRIAKSPIKTAKSAGSKAVAFTKKHPKTALGITGVAAYKYGRRKERKKQKQVTANLSPGFKKWGKRTAGFAGGLGAAGAGTAAGTALGSVGGPIGMLVGGAVGGAAGAWGAHRAAKKLGGKHTAQGADIGGLVGSLGNPLRMGAKLLGRGAAKAVTKAAATKTAVTGSKLSRFGKGAGRFALDTGAFMGTTAGLDKAFGPKVRKPRQPTYNAWTDEARRKSAETRRRNAAARQGSHSNTVKTASGGLAAGIVVARVAGGKIERATELKHIATGARAVRKVVKKSFEPTIKYIHDPQTGRNVMYRQPPGVGRKALRLLKRIRPRVGTLLRMMRK